MNKFVEQYKIQYNFDTYSIEWLKVYNTNLKDCENVNSDYIIRLTIMQKGIHNNDQEMNMIYLKGNWMRFTKKLKLILIIP